MVVNKSSKLLTIYIYVMKITQVITHLTWRSLVTTELGPEASDVTVEFKVYYPASKSHWLLPKYY